MDNQLSIAARQLAHGSKYPYDGGDQAAPAIDWAHSAARGVLADLLDRRGVKWELEEVDQDVRVDIVTALAAIIRVAAPSPRTAPEVDERAIAELALTRARMLGTAGMEFAAHLCLMGVRTIDGIDYIPRDGVMNEVAAWRRAFDTAPEVNEAARRTLASRSAEVDDERPAAAASDSPLLIGIVANIQTTEYGGRPLGGAAITCALTVRSTELWTPGRLWLVDPSNLRLPARGAS